MIDVASSTSPGSRGGERPRRRARPARRTPARNRKAASGRPHAASGGTTSAPTSPPTGIAVCRIPSASPRSAGAEPLHDGPPAGRVDARSGMRPRVPSSTNSDAEASANAAPTRNTAHAAKPTASADALAEPIGGQPPGEERERRPRPTRRRAGPRSRRARGRALPEGSARGPGARDEAWPQPPRPRRAPPASDAHR